MKGKFIYVDSDCLADIEAIKDFRHEFDLSDRDVVKLAVRFWLQSEASSSGKLDIPDEIGIASGIADN